MCLFLLIPFFLCIASRCVIHKFAETSKSPPKGLVREAAPKHTGQGWTVPTKKNKRSVSRRSATRRRPRGRTHSAFAAEKKKHLEFCGKTGQAGAQNGISRIVDLAVFYPIFSTIYFWMFGNLTVLSTHYYQLNYNFMPVC